MKCEVDEEMAKEREIEVKKKICTYIYFVGANKMFVGVSYKTFKPKQKAHTKLTIE